MIPTPPLLRTFQAAEILGCSTRTIQRYIDDGKLLAWKRGGERVTTQEAIDLYLASLEPVKGKPQ